MSTEREARIRERLDREEVERKLSEVAFSDRGGHPSDGAAGLSARTAVLAHDAAQRAEIERLERIVRHTLCDCGPVDNPDLAEHADYCRARTALDADRGGQGE